MKIIEGGGTSNPAALYPTQEKANSMTNQANIDELQTKLNELAKKNNEQAKILEANGLTPIPKILIGVPILAWTHEFALSFLRFWTELMTTDAATRKFHVGFEFKYRRPVQLAEEELADLAVKSDCTHLLLMDDDIYDVTAEGLFKLLDADKDVIGGIMYTSGFPHAMCAFRRFDPSKSVADQPKLTETCRLYEIPAEQRVGIQHVDLIPFGFTLIKTSVFKQLEKPWFKCDTQAPTDSWFADSILNKGLEYFCHFDVWLNHRGIKRENVNFHMQLGMHEAQQKKDRCIELTAEQMAQQELMVQQRMKDAEERFKGEAVRRMQFYEKSKGSGIAKPIQVAPLIINQEKQLCQATKD